jgi:uncharacterized protein YidB (DUF937 family)
MSDIPELFNRTELMPISGTPCSICGNEPYFARFLQFRIVHSAEVKSYRCHATAEANCRWKRTHVCIRCRIPTRLDACNIQSAPPGEEKAVGLFDHMLGNSAQSGMGMGQNPLMGLLGGMFGGNRQQGDNMLGMVLGMVQQMGGIGAVLNMFRQRGMSQQADSWVGTGANQPISGDDVENVFGASRISQLASQAGVPEDQARSGFAQILPELMNQFTPEGRVPENQDDMLSQSMSSLRGFMQ